ncbi:MAG: Fe-S cluster assembly protein HesB [Acidimicrobiales bacterium]
MLVLTDQATSVIRALNDQSELSDDAGLRITGPADGPTGLAISRVGTPSGEDQVIEQEGARVFLDPTAADLLDGMVLDAKVDTDGSVRFTLASQSPEPPL